MFPQAICTLPRGLTGRPRSQATALHGGADRLAPCVSTLLLLLSFFSLQQQQQQRRGLSTHQLGCACWPDHTTLPNRRRRFSTQTQQPQWRDKNLLAPLVSSSPCFALGESNSNNCPRVVRWVWQCDARNPRLTSSSSSSRCRRRLWWVLVQLIHPPRIDHHPSLERAWARFVVGVPRYPCHRSPSPI